MRYVWAIVCTLLISTPALSGGMSGGTGIGSIIEEITDDIQAILNCKIDIDQETVRRILMRLWVYGEAEIKIGDKTIQIKWRIDETESADQIEVRALGN